MTAKRGTIDDVIWVWVVVLVVVIGAVAVVAAGRDTSMADAYEDRPDRTVPAGRALTADDLDSVRLSTGLRGYRMDEVDALIDRLRADLAAREQATTNPADAAPGTHHQERDSVSEAEKLGVQPVETTRSDSGSGLGGQHETPQTDEEAAAEQAHDDVSGVGRHEAPERA